MGIILWIIFGALAGWIASLIVGTNDQQGCLLDIIVGIIGAFIGGFVFSRLIGVGISGFNFSSLLVAIAGAVILLFIVKAIQRRT